MEIYRNFSLFIILIPTPDFPHFYYILGGNLGSLLYGDVSVMLVMPVLLFTVKRKVSWLGKGELIWLSIICHSFVFVRRGFL